MQDSIHQWETVIGIETHVQLTTNSKIFSAASAQYGAPPNVQACAVDLALPGVLPVLNRQAVECAIRFGVAVGASVAERSVFARKNYFYPDLPKGYQISQFEQPVVSGGSLNIMVGSGAQQYDKQIQLTRAHLEEDAGKSLHEDFHGYTGIDLNRAGTPLLEIVTEPDMRSSDEAVAYAKALHDLVRWIGICDGNMQEGSFRCDANVSLRRKGSTELGTRREIKNLNSFRFLKEAIEAEINWQREQLEEGQAIKQATVLFDPDRGETRMMRSKEDAHDYRYFPDPDLLPLVISAEWLAEVRAALPELPAQKNARYRQQYQLSDYDAGVLTSSWALAEYFEQALAEAGVASAKLCANWVMGELTARCNRDNLTADVAPIKPAMLGQLVLNISEGKLSHSAAKQVFELLWQNDSRSIAQIVTDEGLAQINDDSLLNSIVAEVIASNPDSIAQIRAGKEKALNALVGKVMKNAQGKANPQLVLRLLRQQLQLPELG